MWKGDLEDGKEERLRFTQYQVEAWKTMSTPGDRRTLLEYSVLGLSSEAGEVAGKLKKMIRDKNNQQDEEFIHSMIAELGDVLWYVAAVATLLGVGLDSVARKNLEKLQSRLERGKIQGEGDHR